MSVRIAFFCQLIEYNYNKYKYNYNRFIPIASKGAIIFYREGVGHFLGSQRGDQLFFFSGSKAGPEFFECQRGGD